MQKAPRLENEAERLDELQQYELLHTDTEPSFERYARLASSIAGMPIAIVSVVDDARQLFKARVGIDETSTAREISFCAHTIAQKEPLVVGDATLDPRFADNELVVGELKIRSYAGVALRSSRGLALGTLAVLDTRPREISTEQLDLLVCLAQQVESDLEARRKLVLLGRRIEEARESEAALLCRASMDELDLLLYTAERSAEGMHVRPSSQLEALLEQSSDDETIDALLDLVHPEDRPIVEFTIRSPAAAAYPVLARWRRQNGEFMWIEQANALIHDDEGRLIRIEARGSRRGAKLDHLERLATSRASLVAGLAESQRRRDELVALVVHDLKAPISALLAASQALGGSKNLGPVDREILDEMELASRSLDRLVHGLLDLHRHEGGALAVKCVQAPVAPLIAEAVGLVRVYARMSGQSIDVRVPQDAEAFVDPELFRRVIENLLDNASRYAKRQISIEVEPGSDSLIVDVEDDGVGIPPDARTRIFEKYATLEPSRRGRGLGLAFCKMAVEAQGGSIVAKSSRIGGASFRIQLPRAA